VAFKDRIDCRVCGKEVLNPERKSISDCPHCGAWMPVAIWMDEESKQELIEAARGSDTSKNEAKRSGLRRLFKKSA